MNKPSQVNELEYVELARALDQLAEGAPTIDPGELIVLWPDLERRVLACLRASSLPQVEEQRLRNLAWEIAVSVDLRAVHVGAVRGLAMLLRERAQRFGRRAASHGSSAHAAR